MTEVEELRAEVEKLKAERKPAHEPFDAAVEVTACVLGFNNWRHLWAVLTAYFRQGVSLHLRSAVDRASKDPTLAILSSPDLGPWLTSAIAGTIRTYQYLGDVPHHEQIPEVCAHAMTKFTDACDTEFIYFNDGDVVTPQGALKKLLEEMKADDTIGALCIPYEQKTDHQLKGAMLMRRDVAHEVRFNGKGRCVCWDLAERFKKIGLRMTAWESGQMAEHGKYWR